MSALQWLQLPSQQQVCAKLSAQVLKGEPFILLSGPVGSGRTVILESLVAALERKVRAVYLPCRPEMSAMQLRETLLRQLLPESELSFDLNLADTLLNTPIPGKQKILVIVDDADTVVASFFNELCALHREFLGKNRLAFVLSGQPLWAEQLQNAVHDIELSEVQVPPLSGGEALKLTRQIFKNNGLGSVYNSLENKLPQALSRLQGNVGEIIKYTGLLMAEQKSSSAVKAEAPQISAAPAKKRSYAGLFITIICIIIVLGCLGALFVGGSLFKGEEPQEMRQVSDSSVPATSADASQLPVIDDGALQHAIPEGIEASTPPSSTQRSITLSGEELEQIEEAGSNRPDLPRRDVAGSQVKRTDAANASSATAADKADVQTLSRAANALRQAAAPAAQQEPQQPAEALSADEPAKPARKAADGAAAAVQPKAAVNQEPAAAKSQPAAAQTPSADVSTRASAASPARRGGASAGVVRPENVPFSGQAIPGGSSELAYKNDAHYTVQVVAGTQRERIVQVSAALQGRYWIYRTQRAGRPWYVLICGEYPNRAAALDAARQLPLSVRAAGPFAKSFAAVKAEMAVE